MKTDEVKPYLTGAYRKWKGNIGERLMNVKVINIDDNRAFSMLGQGNTAEIYEYGDGKILKLFRDNMTQIPIENEYRMSCTVQNNLDNVPRVYEMVSYRHRFGIVYEQIKGTGMIQMFLKNVFKMKENADCFAKIHADIHMRDIDTGYTVKEKLKNDIDAEDYLRHEEKEKIKQYLEKLPDKKKLCHFDFHPGNVIYKGKTPMIIDWMTACTGDPCADVARTMLLLRMGEMMHISVCARIMMHIAMRKIGKEYYRKYKQLTNSTDDDVNQWMLPVAAARLTEWLTEHERKKLVAFVRARLLTEYSV